MGFAPFVFFMAQLIFMGMMELASQLADPFGDDEVDFPIKKWLGHFFESAAVLLEYDFKGSENHWQLKLEEQAWAPLLQKSSWRLQTSPRAARVSRRNDVEE